jgi:soluble lytic murein transglycosylase-like protein
MRWRPIVDRWCVELKVSQSLILAIIQQESNGDSNAMRYEPGYEKQYIIRNPEWEKRCQDTGITTREAATSYGLMQLMFTTAWGFNCRWPRVLLDPSTNIRFGTAHVAGKLKKYTVQEMLTAYNGGDGAVKDLRAGKITKATEYSRKVMSLYEQYKAYMTVRAAK